MGGFCGRNEVSDAFLVPLLKGAPEKRIFTNHVPQLRLKVNSSVRTEFRVWKWSAGLYSVKTIKMSRIAINSLPILWLLHRSICCCEADCTVFCSQICKTSIEDFSDTPETPCCFLTAPICVRDCVWNFLSTSDRNHPNTPIDPSVLWLL